jgi:DNA-binding protein H-NS
MMSIDLDKMSLKDLKDLNAKVVKAISGYEDRKKKEAIAQLEEFARAKGFNLAELTGAVVTRKRAPAVAKYANPANRSETWSGRGRKPRWFVAALNSGKNPGDLAI